MCGVKVIPTQPANSRYVGCSGGMGIKIMDNGGWGKKSE